MRLTAYRDGRRTIVARRTSSGEVAPLAEADEFWSDPYGWLAHPNAKAAPRSASDLEIVPAVRGSARILCVGLNYQAHADEGPFTAPSHPTVFGRWAASLATSGAEVRVPPDEPGLDWEGELAVVVGRPLSRASVEEARSAVFGYAAFNDITARTAQRLSTQWTLGKNVDGSGPLSDIVTADEVGDVTDGLLLTTHVNGEIVQSARTNEVIFSIDYLLTFISRTMTLHPGDIVATGTPSGVGYARNPPWFLNTGDTVVVDIERVGSVTTNVVASTSASDVNELAAVNDGVTG
ncbi:MAG TPA: fumarylacetoacetate hydrolase family protein [Acidothermaceae bacterium]|jgi:2-keto-4-pentenoate hydratase/2-oxohepta-3-ene-1,7-dioic acid hydratase in catechol pathway